MSQGFAGKAASLAPNEKTPKVAPPKFSDKLKAISTPRVPRTTLPVTSGMGALEAATHGTQTYDRPPMMRPEDVKTLRKHSAAHDLLSKEGNLRSMALVNGLVAHGNWNSAAANRIHVSNGKVVFDGNRQQQAESMALLNPSSNKWLASAQELASAGPGFALLADQGVHHPLGTAESVGKSLGSSMAGTFTRGHYGSKTNTPLDDLLNIWTVASLGTAGVLKASGRYGEAMAPRSIKLGDATIHAPVSRNPAAALIQKRIHDRLLTHGLNSGNIDLAGSLPGIGKHVSREARVGRMVRRHLSVESSLAGAPAHELATFEKLTPAEKHAAWMSLTGMKPAAIARAFENGGEHADHLAQLEGQSPTFIRENHGKLAGLTRAAAAHLDEHGVPTTPRVKAAVDAIRRAISQREGLRGMDESQVNHSLGSRWYAIHHLADNPTGQSLHHELEALAKVGTPQAEARIEQIHQLFHDKGAAIADRASYLPMMNEAKPLRARASQAVTRRAGPYGVSAPRGERTYEYSGHLLNRGDFRTDAVSLAQHSFGKARHLESQQQLHKMLLGLSKETPEAVGHPHPVPIRAETKLPPELKRFVNRLHEQDPHSAEAQTADELWKHFLNPGKTDNVRFLHPDLLRTLKPHQVSQLGRNLNRFNSLIRAQRYLNPKYGIWAAQNAAVSLPQQGLMVGPNMARYFRTLRHLDPETYAKIESGVGAQGMSKSILTPVDTQMTRKLGTMWHHINDHAWRMASFAHEARRRGYNTAADFKRLMNSTDAKVVADKHDIIANANNKAINYGLTPFENAHIRPGLAYYPWTKGASLWTLRLLRDHPMWAQLELEAGRRGKKYVDDFFAKHGGLPPPTSEGMYPAKGGPIDMEFANTPSTLAQDAEALAGIGNPHARKYLNGALLGQASPIVKDIADVGTGLTSRGKQSQSPLGQAAHDMTSGGPLPALKALLGKPPAGKTKQQELLHYMGWLQEPGVNYNDQAAMGASIDKNSLRGASQAQADTSRKLLQVDQLARKLKMDASEKNAYLHYWRADGVLHSTLAQAASKVGVRSDDYKKAEQSLSYSHPDAYTIAVFTAAAKVTGQKEMIAGGKDLVRSVMADNQLNKEQKATVLFQQATKFWESINPTNIKSLYYQRIDQAGL